MMRASRGGAGGFDRRRYGREYARRQRRADWERRTTGRSRCPRRFGQHGVCGALLRDVVDRTGRVTVVCDACERMARGICADCPAPVDGTVGFARRCTACKRLTHQDQTRRYTRDHRRAVNARARRSYRTDPEKRAVRNAYKVLWRLASPEKVRRQKRRRALRSPEHDRERARQYRATHADRRYAPGIRPCVGACGVTVTGRAKKCEGCKGEARALARGIIAARMERAECAA